MKKLIPILCVIFLIGCKGETHDTYETYPDIRNSSVHSDTLLITVRSEELEDDLGGADNNSDNGIHSDEPAGLTRERIIAYAEEVYGVSYEWCVWLIGTTYREEYWDDRYLEYAWACEILNEYTDRSAWELDGIWGDYYTLDKAYDGFYAADATTLEMIWEAMTDRDTRIVEVDGMIRWYVPGYYLIYDSPYYNCQVWGKE